MAASIAPFGGDANHQLLQAALARSGRTAGESLVSQTTPLLVVTYAEIALKGKNRPAFQRRLLNNIRRALRGEAVVGIDHLESRLLVRLSDPDCASAVAEKLARVFGIEWISPAIPIARAAEPGEEDHQAVMAQVCEVARGLARQDVGDARHFKVDARRSDRAFGLISPEINLMVGTAVGEELQLPARMSHPDFIVHVLVMKREILVFTGKITGPSGLPSGVSGRLMCLLSGGIDSPVAAWLMMRRGCRPEFVHFYSGRSVAEADVGKIEELVRILGRYSPVALNLHLVPVVAYELRAIGTIRESYDMVMFRRFMFKTAHYLARRNSCLGLVAGDSLGQVASQTLPNLAAITPDLSAPILRPLIGMTKNEITALSKRIGAYTTSIQPYRDCCSIRSPRPVLNAHANDLLRMSEEMDLDGAVKDAVAETTKVVISGDQGRDHQRPGS